MNKRLVWNFEINNDRPDVDVPRLDRGIHSERWEARFFWPDNTPVILNGLDDSFLTLSNFEFRHRQDTYCILPDADYNLKYRHEKLLYKPRLAQSSHASAYGKKINLDETASETRLPGIVETTRELMTRIQHEGRRIFVDKSVLIYKFETVPKTKLELARLSVANTTWFSVSIEARSKTLVESLAQQLLDHHMAYDYVAFLKRFT